MATKKPPAWHIETFSRRTLRQRHYFRIVGANGETLAQSEGYSRAVDRDGTAGLIAGPAGASVTAA